MKTSDTVEITDHSGRRIGMMRYGGGGWSVSGVNEYRHITTAPHKNPDDAVGEFMAAARTTEDRE